MVGLEDLVVFFYLCGSVILISADGIWCRAKVERTCFSIKKHNSASRVLGGCETCVSTCRERKGGEDFDSANWVSKTQLGSGSHWKKGLYTSLGFLPSTRQGLTGAFVHIGITTQSVFLCADHWTLSGIKHIFWLQVPLVLILCNKLVDKDEEISDRFPHSYQF